MLIDTLSGITVAWVEKTLVALQNSPKTSTNTEF